MIPCRHFIRAVGRAVNLESEPDLQCGRTQTPQEQQQEQLTTLGDQDTSSAAGAGLEHRFRSCSKSTADPTGSSFPVRRQTRPCPLRIQSEGPLGGEGPAEPTAMRNDPPHKEP
jgi:hypothetical protein